MSLLQDFAEANRLMGKKKRALLETYLKETGKDYGHTIYNPDEWDLFETRIKSKEVTQ